MTFSKIKVERQAPFHTTKNLQIRCSQNFHSWLFSEASYDTKDQSILTAKSPGGNQNAYKTLVRRPQKKGPVPRLCKVKTIQAVLTTLNYEHWSYFLMDSIESTCHWSMSCWANSQYLVGVLLYKPISLHTITETLRIHT